MLITSSVICRTTGKREEQFLQAMQRDRDSSGVAGCTVSGSRRPHLLAWWLFLRGARRPHGVRVRWAARSCLQVPYSACGRSYSSKLALFIATLSCWTLYSWLWFSISVLLWTCRRESLLKTFKRALASEDYAIVLLDAVNNQISHFQDFAAFSRSLGYQVYSFSSIYNLLLCLFLTL